MERTRRVGKTGDGTEDSQEHDAGAEEGQRAVGGAGMVAAGAMVETAGSITDESQHRCIQRFGRMLSYYHKM